MPAQLMDLQPSRPCRSAATAHLVNSADLTLLRSR
jgi:hypothetical protein